MHICDNKCFYYPENPSKIIKEYIDDFGIKHRECEFLCCLDGHRIKSHKKCKNYKIIIGADLFVKKKENDSFLYNEN